ncbi:MAG: hypothetical protein RLZZ299_2901 [Pseudomonadota bacterium]|jgi:hypothetical protein
MLLTLLVTFFHPAAAEDAPDPIVTDRPDIAESSLAVGRGVYQLEQGVSATGLGGTTTVGFPSLSRYGIGHGLELRLETPVVAVQGGAPAFDGVAVGAKWHIPTEALSLGVLAHAAFDAGGDVAPILKLAYDTDLPAGFELGINVGATTAPGLGKASALWATALGRPLNDQLRLYVEASGETSADISSVAFDGGFAYLINDDVQWDVSALYGDGWAAGTGLSVRFDGR